MPELPQLRNEHGTAAEQHKAAKKRRPRPRAETCVAATKLVSKARKSGHGKDTGRNVVFFAGTTRKRKADKADGAKGDVKITTTFAAEALEINTSADLLVDAATHALLVYYRNAIMSGTKPDGSGPQVKLSQASAADPSRLSEYRGFKTGVLADGIRRTAITGTTTKARASILPPTNRNVFVAEEAKRGIFYLRLGGEADKVIQATVQEWLDNAVGNTLREPNAGPLEAETADPQK